MTEHPRPVRVVVVDDHPENVALLTQLLRRAGVARLHELIAEHLPECADAAAAGNAAGPDQVSIGIETDRGPWVTALVAAGYRVFAINPRVAA